MWKPFVAAVCVALAACTTPDQRTSRPSSPEPGPSASAPAEPPSLPAEGPRNRVLVYQLRKGRDGYRPGAYAPAPRPAAGARGLFERLRTALDELVEGPTRAERRAGLTSSFAEDTAGMVSSVDLRGRRAVVDFRDFRRQRPEWSTSYGGSVFLMQLSRTVVQFDRIHSALYRIEGSCRKFYEFLQVEECDPVRSWRVPRAGSRR